QRKSSEQTFRIGHVFGHYKKALTAHEQVVGCKAFAQERKLFRIGGIYPDLLHEIKIRPDLYVIYERALNGFKRERDIGGRYRRTVSPPGFGTNSIRKIRKTILLHYSGHAFSQQGLEFPIGQVYG